MSLVVSVVNLTGEHFKIILHGLTGYASVRH